MSPSEHDGVLKKQHIQKRIVKLIKKPYLLLERFDLFVANIFKLENLIPKYITFISGRHGEVILKSKNSKKIYSHSFDYDKYLKSSENSISLKKEKYFVFLDENIIFHKDYKISDTESPALSETYYNELLLYFQFIEKFTNNRVIIASHPSSDIEFLKKKFNRFDVFKDQTCQLVRQSLGVFVHASTSISFPIIYRKPIYLLTSDELDKSWIGIRMRDFSLRLKRPLINISDKTKFSLFKKEDAGIDKNSYDKYKNDYIYYPNSENILISDQLIRHLKIDK